jgi:large subunit ribosomal protein L35
MPKQKTKKAIAKRFRWTASGKLKRSGAGRGHLFTGKSRKVKRRRRRLKLVSAAEQKRIAVLMPRP